MLKTLRVIFFITLPIVIIMLFAQLLTSHWYMALSEGAYDSHDTIEYDHTYVRRELISYLNYRHDDLTFGADADDNTVLMRDVEVRHMVDVKDLYTMLRIVAFGSLVLGGLSLFMIYKKDKNYFLTTLENSFWVPLGFIAFIGTWVLIDFGRLFTVFHELFFSNDDWLLRSDDVLIQLLPSAFWMISGIIILVGLGLTHLGIVLFSKKVLREKFVK